MSEVSADEVEVIEEHVELDASQTGMITTDGGGGLQERQKAEDIFWLAENIERLVEARNKIVTTMLKLAKPGDWVSFSSKDDPDGTASLGYDGAMRIGSNAGISFVDRKMKKIIGRDKIGEWYRYECEVTCIFRNTQVRTWGRASTRDAFFGKKGDDWKDLSDINEGNVKAAAIHGALKEGVKVLLGITSFPVKELMQMGLNIDFTKGYRFKGSADGDKGAVSSESEQQIREKIRAMLLELNGDETKKAADMLESISGFEGKDGPVKGKRHVDYLKGQWLTATYGKIKVAYKEKFGREYVFQPELTPAA